MSDSASGAVSPDGEAQRQRALLKAEALQDAILGSANFAIIATDEKGIIQLFNVGAERMLGYQASEVVNRINPSDIHDPSEVLARARELSIELGTPITPGFEALAFKASRGIEDIYELTYICKDGSRFPAIVSITALRDERLSVIGYLLIGTDNSARKQVEVDLQKAVFEADRANQAKSDFLSSMSHELRTPLGSILGFAQLIESSTPPPTPAQQRSVTQILKAGWYLLGLINEILDLAMVESGHMFLSLEAVSLGEVLGECHAMVGPEAAQRGIRLRFPQFIEPCIVQADRVRIKQAMINLLSNAIKYNRTDGWVEVACLASPPNRVRIQVKDSGLGLSAAQLARLFEPFNRLGQEASAEQGTGMGLVMAKRLVDLMNGTIGVDSVVGEGSVFWIDLPRATSAPALIELPEALPVPVSAAEGVQAVRTVLYVEDNPANMMLVEELIGRRPDLRLLSARDGHSGIQIARRAQPDVILMDINLPGICGITALQLLGTDPTTAHIPVVALSANALPRDIRRGLDAGFFRYLTKPIKVTEFMDTLETALRFAESGIDAPTTERSA